MAATGNRIRVLLKVAEDDANKARGFTALLEDLPADIEADVLVNLMRRSDSCLALLGHSRRLVELFADKEMATCLSGLTPVAPRLADDASAHDSGIKTVTIYLRLHGDRVHAAYGGGDGGATASVPHNPTFEELLVMGGLRRGALAAGILWRARLKYGNMIGLAIQERNAALAVDAYKRAARLPCTTTINKLTVAGYKVNGLLSEMSDLTICYKGEKIYLLKCLDSTEAARIAVFMEATAGTTLPGITPFELMNLSGCKPVIIMPNFHTSLETLPYLSDEGVLKRWDELNTALLSLHALGFAYVDIKPSNICLNGASAAILIDLGSISRFGSISSSTAAYIPHDFESNRRASASLDWWMLAMTLAEKACGPEHGLKVGEGARSATKAELRRHLEMYLDRRVWVGLEPKLA